MVLKEGDVARGEVSIRDWRKDIALGGEVDDERLMND